MGMDMSGLFIGLLVLALVIVVIIGLLLRKKKGVFAAHPIGKIVAVTAGIVLLIPLLVVFFVTLPWTLIYLHDVFSPDPPKPPVDYAELPFKLVYEIDGEIITVEDTYVIKYKGVDWDEGQGKHNVWYTSFLGQSHGKDYNYVDGAVIILDDLKDGSSGRIEFLLGSCEYYMGLEEEEPLYKYDDVSPGDIVLFSSGYTGPISDEELKNEYGITILEKSISPPLT